MNRKERRTKISMFKKELKSAAFDEFKPIEIPQGKKIPNMGRFVGFYRNSIYSVQKYMKNDAYLIGIRRHDGKPSCPWKHKLAIKNQFIGENIYAIEIFPPNEKLVDQANIYWLWGHHPKIDDLCKEYSI